MFQLTISDGDAFMSKFYKDSEIYKIHNCYGNVRIMCGFVMVGIPPDLPAPELFGAGEITLVPVDSQHLFNGDECVCKFLVDYFIGKYGRIYWSGKIQNSTGIKPRKLSVNGTDYYYVDAPESDRPSAGSQPGALQPAAVEVPF